MSLKKRTTKIESFDSLFSLIFEYFFWSAIILGLFILNFPDFKTDLFHIILSGVIFWLLLGLYFTRKYAKVNFMHSIPPNEIKNYLQQKFPKSFFLKNDKKMIVADIKQGLLFSRKRVFVVIEKNSIKVNIITLGRFDIPSIFHAVSNYKSAKNIARDIISENNDC